MRRLLSAGIFAAALATPMFVPASASAAEGPVNARVTIRVYDPYHHDYHVWNQREQRSYRAYLAERHRSYIAYRRQRLAERRAYWRWRHEREERLERERR